MHNTKRIFSLAAGSALIAILLSATSASAYTVSAPTTYGNISVYLIHGSSNDKVRLNTLDRALENGEARVTVSEAGVRVQNFSDTAVFVPFGTVLKGGVQDQVAGADMIVPPHSEPLDLPTFCVDPFRAQPRAGESEGLLVGIGTTMPSLTAKLIMLTSPASLDTGPNLRWLGVWWSLDAIKARLSSRFGHPLTPAKPASWTLTDSPNPSTQLRDRTGAWVNGLALDLDDASLAGAERPITAALAPLANSSPDIVGAAFVINGHWIGTQINSSHALFAMIWPSLLRGHVIESLVEEGKVQVPVPTASEIAATIDQPFEPAQGQAVSGIHRKRYEGPRYGRLLMLGRDDIAERRIAGFLNAYEPRQDQAAGGMTIFDRGSSMMTRIIAGGQVVQTTLLPKRDPAIAAADPAELILSMLTASQIDGRALPPLQETPYLTRRTVLDPMTGHNHDVWSVAAPAPDARRADGATTAQWSDDGRRLPLAGRREALFN